MNRMKIKSIDFSKYSLNELLRLSSEIDQLISNENFPEEKITYREAKGIALLYKNMKTSLTAKDIISRINKAIVMKNNELEAKENSEEKLDQLMKDEKESDRFIIKQTPTGFSFEIVSSNNKLLAKSEMYSTLNGCRNGIESFKSNSSISKIEDQTYNTVAKKSNPKFEIFIDKSNEYRFRLKARNGEIIAVSDGHKSRESCFSSIKQIKENALKAETVRL
jgi:uncharacterized protein